MHLFLHNFGAYILPGYNNTRLNYFKVSKRKRKNVKFAFVSAFSYSLEHHCSLRYYSVYYFDKIKGALLLPTSKSQCSQQTATHTRQLL